MIGMIKNIFFCILFISNTVFSATVKIYRSTASERMALRVDHAKELMGKGYKRSIVSKFDKKKNLEKNIFRIVKRRLPKMFKPSSKVISKTIIQESYKHSLDPYFVLAVISGESSFNPNAIGPVGEIGMMQLRKSTAKWIASIENIQWSGEKSLKDPVTNIKLGIAYLSWLRSKFQGHGQLYVAAYNMGPTSVKNAVQRNIYPKDYPIHVMKRYVAFYREMKAQLQNQ